MSLRERAAAAYAKAKQEEDDKQAAEAARNLTVLQEKAQRVLSDVLKVESSEITRVIPGRVPGQGWVQVDGLTFYLPTPGESIRLEPCLKHHDAVNNLDVRFPSDLGRFLAEGRDKCPECTNEKPAE